MQDWLVGAAEATRSNEALASAMLEELRRRHVIVPGPTTVERACADALVEAERRIARRIVDRLDGRARGQLTRMLSETLQDDTSRFVWLRRHEPGGNSADANRLLDRLEWLNGLAIPGDCLLDIPPHRIARLRPGRALLCRRAARATRSTAPRNSGGVRRRMARHDR